MGIPKLSEWDRGTRNQNLRGITRVGIQVNVLLQQNHIAPNDKYKNVKSQHMY